LNTAEAVVPSHRIFTGQVIPETQAYFGKLTNPDSLVSLDFVDEIEPRKRKNAIENLIPAPQKYKKEWKFRKRIRISRELASEIAEKYEDTELLRLANSDFIFIRVKNIRKTKPTSEYAYDLSVPPYENFGGTVFYHNTKHDKGLTTEIGKGLGELYKVPGKKRAQYYRLKKWHKRLIESKDRNLSFALSELQRLVSFLNIPKPIHERIARYYEEAVDKGLVRGRSIESVIAALVYGVSRQFGSPRTLDEVAEASGLEKREIGRTYRYIARELKIRILPSDPKDFVPRFCSMLNLSDRVQATAIKILDKAKKLDITSGKGPTGVAAAAIYIACVLTGEKRTQREVASIINVTEVTIRNRYKELVEKLGLEEEIAKQEENK
jgi:transcription initiation factor TFIIB